MRKVFAMALLAALLLAPLARAVPAVPNSELAEAFSQAAFRAEYDSAGMDALRRWAKPLVFSVEGGATWEDRAVLEGFLLQLNEQVVNLPPVSLAASPRQANVRVVFAPLKELPKKSRVYVPGNWGFFTFWYNGDWEMEEAQVLIATDVTSQKERNHLLMEEIVGLLGLTNDLEGHKDSIIHQGWTTTQELSLLDWELLNLLYDRRLSPGMDWLQARRALGLD